MSKNTKFIEADYWMSRPDEKNEIQIRMISDEVVMFKNLNVEDMKLLRDFLNRQIDEFEKEA